MAMTHTSPVAEPMAAETHGPRARGALADAMRRLISHTAVAAVTPTRSPPPRGCSAPEMRATPSHTITARPQAAMTGRLSRVSDIPG